MQVFHGATNGFADRDQVLMDEGDLGEVGEEDDLLGITLATGDFDGTGHDALVVGVPDEDASGLSDAGLTAVITGDSALLFADGFETGDTSRWSATIP